MPWFWRRSPGREDKITPKRRLLAPVPAEWRELFDAILDAAGMLDEAGLPLNPAEYEDIIQAMARRFDVYVMTQICMAMPDKAAKEYLQLFESGAAGDVLRSFLAQYVPDAQALHDRAAASFVAFYLEPERGGQPRSPQEVAYLVLNRAPPYGMSDED